MSLPILKALYICTRLFFCHRMKFPLVILLIVILTTETYSQTAHQLLESVDCINKGFVSSNNQVNTPHIGFRLRNSPSDTTYIPYKISFSSLDSNSYSRVNFNIGSIATQNISLSLLKPLNNSALITLSIFRASNPGWVARSFVRETKILIGYSQRVSNKLEVSVFAGVNSLDREQSGGVLDSLVYNLQARGQTELNLEGNIWLTNAYSRKIDAFAESRIDYSLLELKQFKLKPGLVLLGSYKKINYVDQLPDSAYYSHFEAEFVNEINDSLILNNFGMRPHVILELMPNDSSTLYFDIGMNQSWFDLTNNGHESGPVNQSMTELTNLDMKRFKFIGKGEWYIAGYNQNDIRVSSRLNYSLISTDSSVNVLSIEARQIYSSGRVARVFEDYRSKVKTTNHRLNREKYEGYSGAISARVGNVDSKAGCGYMRIGNFAYFDQYGQVNQKNVAIEVYSANLEITYRNSFLVLKSIGRYQWTGRSKYYSLPEWTNINEGSIYWDMFRKKLRMNGGVQTKFFSEYFNRGYIPFYDVNYVQSYHRFDNYFQVDGVIQTSIKSVTVGFVAYNLFYSVWNENPIIAPNMPSVPRYFSLRFDWKFKN